MNCNHEKVYSPYVHASFPAQHPWICRVCGEKGVDTDTYYNDPKEYFELDNKYHPKTVSISSKGWYINDKCIIDEDGRICVETPLNIDEKYRNK